MGPSAGRTPPTPALENKLSLEERVKKKYDEKLNRQEGCSA